MLGERVSINEDTYLNKKGKEIKEYDESNDSSADLGMQFRDGSEKSEDLWIV